MSSPWTVQYHQHVLAMNPIAYWVLGEKSGTVAYDLVSGRAAGAQNGAHTNVTLWQNGIGDGRTCPLYNGATSYTNAFSATLAGVVNGQEGSVVLWAKVANVGVWTDSTRRDMFFTQADANNFLILRRNVGNNELGWVYNANGTTKSVALGGQTTTDWMHVGVTFSRSAGANGQMIAYYNGAQTGATQTALGTWAGAIVSCLVGATTVAPGNVWSGYIAHCAVWNRPILASEIQKLYRAKWS